MCDVLSGWDRMEAPEEDLHRLEPYSSGRGLAISGKDAERGGRQIVLCVACADVKGHRPLVLDIRYSHQSLRALQSLGPQNTRPTLDTEMEVQLQ